LVSFGKIQTKPNETIGKLNNSMAADTYRSFTNFIYTKLSPFPSRKITELCIFLTAGIADFLARL
jgi:hypothetical protein